jgi:alpha-L-rhamnosidase
LVGCFALKPDAIVADAEVALAIDDPSIGWAELRINHSNLPRFAYQTGRDGPGAIRGEAATFLQPGLNVLWLDIGWWTPGDDRSLRACLSISGLLNNGRPFSWGTDHHWKQQQVEPSDGPSTGDVDRELHEPVWLPNPNLGKCPSVASPPSGGLNATLSDWPVAHGVDRFRKSGVHLDEPIRCATWRLAARGWAATWINGQRTSDAVLDPAPTAYEQRTFVVTHDVTPLLETGDNAIGIELAEGWYGQGLVWWPQVQAYGRPSVSAKLTVEFASGRTLEVSTDDTWHTARGPITRSNVYAGEDHDGRLALAQRGWSRAEFSATDWRPAEETAPPSGRLEDQMIAPCRVTEWISPRRINRPYPGVRVIDFGENLAGWVRLEGQAPAGTQAVLRFGEMLHPDGRVDDLSTGVRATRVAQLDRYTFRGPMDGEAEERSEPRYTYHGFRYVQVTGLPDDAEVRLTAGRVHNDLPVTGDFDCSDPRLMRQLDSAKRTFLSNAHGILTDCPHRERCAWHADLELACDFGLLLFDSGSLYVKSLDDTLATLDPDGLPYYISCGRRLHPPCDDLGWSSVIAQVSWRLYQQTGERGVIQRAWPAMRRVLDDALSKRERGLLRRAAWGDHAPPMFDRHGRAIPVCDKTVYATLVLVDLLGCTICLAEWLGHGEVAATWRVHEQQTRQAFVDQLWCEAEGGFGHQTADAWALLLGLHPAAGRDRLVASLERSVAEHDGLNVGGFFGHRRVAEAMLRFGDEAAWYRMMTRPVFPGVAWSLECDGATTAYECFWPPEMLAYRERSRNHPPYAATSEILPRLVGGLAPDPEAVDLDRWTLRPHGVGVLEHASAWRTVKQGRITSSWQRVGDQLRWELEVPEGVTATVQPPRAATSPLHFEQGFVSAQVERGHRVGPGRYRVTCSVAVQPVLDD